MQNEWILQRLYRHQRALEGCVEALADPLARASQTLADALTNGSKVLTWGQGGAASLAWHAATLFMDRLHEERPALPALLLDADPLLLASLRQHSGDPTSCGLLRQFQAFGHPGDVLLLFDAPEPSDTLEMLVASAFDREVSVIAIGGAENSPLHSMLREVDTLIPLPQDAPTLQLELQAMALHVLCEALDQRLMGDEHG